MFLAIIAFTASAQNKHVVSGKVVDKATKQDLVFANVVLASKAGDKQQLGTVTQENGQFSFNDLAKGDYTLTISYLGYKTVSKTLLIGALNNYFDFGKIALAVDNLALDEVSVEAKRTTLSTTLDKKTFNISDNLSQAGGSVMDAMRNLPGVTVNQEGKVLLRGSDKVSVLIDGKQSSITGFGNQKGLDNIASSNIERIEIINNPSAKYSANGMAGIINIIYKKEQRTGFNGDAAFNFGLGELTSRKNNLPNIMEKYAWTPKYAPSINLNYRAEKVNLFLQSGAMFRKKVNCNEFFTRTYTDGSPAIASQFLENRSQQVYDIKAGVDLYLNERNELTIFGLIEDEYHIDEGHVPYDYIETGERKRFWKWAEDERKYFINYGANYTHKFLQEGHQLGASFLYSHGNEDELFPFTDESESHNSADSTHLNAKEKITSLTIDYVKPFRTGRLELGAKMQLRDIPISYTVMSGSESILDKQLGEWSEYKEDIFALYLNYVYESKRFDVEAGLRAEHASIRYNIDADNQYYPTNESYNDLSLFPNVRFTYKMNSSNRLSIFYNRRVDRPGEFELRPFPKYDDPEILKTGNPYLRPQFTQTMELAYKGVWQSGSLFVSGYYKLIDDIFERIYTKDKENTNVLNSIPQNLDKGNNIGMEIIAEQQITSKWDASLSFNWYRNTINAFAGESLYPYAQSFSFAESVSNTWNMKLNTAVQLPNAFDLQASYAYYAPDIIPQGEIKQRSSLDLGLRKKLMHGKLELSLSATDLLNTFALRKTIVGDGFTLTSDNYYETQVITLGAKYKF